MSEKALVPEEKNSVFTFLGVGKDVGMVSPRSIIYFHFILFQKCQIWKHILLVLMYQLL